MSLVRNIGILAAGAVCSAAVSSRRAEPPDGTTTIPRTAASRKTAFEDQENGPGLILVEGGQFTMGRVTDDLRHDWDNVPRTVTVSSFYMDEVEVTNFYWLEYLYWLDRVFAADYPRDLQESPA
jgi:formylglycine-generating enzyme required for sulfatase activity